MTLYTEKEVLCVVGEALPELTDKAVIVIDTLFASGQITGDLRARSREYLGLEGTE